MPICKCCSEDKSQDDFYFRKNEDRFETTCKKCRNKNQWKRVKDGKVNKRETFDFKCINCNIQKSSSDYYMKDKKTNRYDSTCKSCRKDTARKCYADNTEQSKSNNKEPQSCPESHREESQPCTYYYEDYKRSRRRWYQDNKEIIREKHKKWREDNIEKYKETCKKWYEDNKDSVKERSKKWYQYNHEKGKETRKKWQENNKEKYKESIKKWRENNVQYNLGNSYRIKCASPIKNSTKSKNKYLSCSGEYARRWLEFQFSENMNWDNYGKVWEIDHVIPVSSFDMENEEDVKECFHWTNIQPLTQEQNLEKSNNINEEAITSHLEKITNFINKI